VIAAVTFLVKSAFGMVEKWIEQWSLNSEILETRIVNGHRNGSYRAIGIKQPLLKFIPGIISGLLVAPHLPGDCPLFAAPPQSLGLCQTGFECGNSLMQFENFLDWRKSTCLLKKFARWQQGSTWNSLAKKGLFSDVISMVEGSSSFCTNSDHTSGGT
jgi:hypothetical protein